MIGNLHALFGITKFARVESRSAPGSIISACSHDIHRKGEKTVISIFFLHEERPKRNCSPGSGDDILGERRLKSLFEVCEDGSFVDFGSADHGSESGIGVRAPR